MHVSPVLHQRGRVGSGIRIPNPQKKVLRGSGAAVRTARRIAAKSAVVLSQARGNGVYEKFSEDTFPAVPAQERAVTSTCCASLKACPSILSRTESHPSATIHCCRGPVARPRVRKIARRVS